MRFSRDNGSFRSAEICWAENARLKIVRMMLAITETGPAGDLLKHVESMMLHFLNQLNVKSPNRDISFHTMMGFWRVRPFDTNTRTSSICHQHENEPMKSLVSILALLVICLLPAHCVLADGKMNEVIPKKVFSTSLDNDCL
jgi:hypothetical protein